MANGEVFTKYLMPIIGAVIVALQGANLHNTGEASNEARMADQEASAELKTLREVQIGIAESSKRQEQILSILNNNQKIAIDGIKQIKEKLGISISSGPTPQ